jgi:type II restriction enzyme
VKLSDWWYKMNLTLDISLAEGYHSNSQKARVLTETWVKQNIYCPLCGKERIEKFENNRPVADFYCDKCKEIYELKSKNGNLSNIINDGAYSTMIDRITSNTNPDFFFLTYNLSDYVVENFIIIPKHFFTPDIIIKRKPLAQNARRAGWIGCNINLSSIPNEGKIFLVRHREEIPKEQVLNNVKKNLFLKKQDIKNRGWILDIMNCVDRINSNEFSLNDIYEYEEYLHKLHPNNNNIKAKIRQQLQILRDNNCIEFLGNGKYLKRR